MPKLMEQLDYLRGLEKWLLRHNHSTDPKLREMMLILVRDCIEQLTSKTIPHVKELETIVVFLANSFRKRPGDWEVLREAKKRADRMLEEGKIDFTRYKV